MKIGLLSRLLLTSPTEFISRMLTITDFQTDRIRRPATIEPLACDLFTQRLSDESGLQLPNFLNEDGLVEIVGRIKAARTGPTGVEGFHDASLSLAALCYALCRAQQPEIVIETGVGNGITTSFILQALALNGAGQLWSIDLPPLGANGSGHLVPEDLKSRWHLIKGRTREKLPKLARQLGSVDLFVHDSLHTYRNMRFEFETVWPYLGPGGIVVSDDIAMNRAFEDFFGSKGTFFARRNNFGAAIARKSQKHPN